MAGLRWRVRYHRHAAARSREYLRCGPFHSVTERYDVRNAVGPDEEGCCSFVFELLKIVIFSICGTEFVFLGLRRSMANKTSLHRWPCSCTLLIE